jgi:O-antigen/teichoic acid export membrane protein
MPLISSLLDRLKKTAGLDRAIVYAVSARVWTILSNLVTVVLMTRYLSPIEQGYYFTLTALVALQVIFELGFSFVIMQHAAHERAYLQLAADGRIEGDPRAHSRLASVLQLAVRWYSRAAIILGTFLIPAGIYFFSSNEQMGVSVHWLFPWLLSAAACIAVFLQDPLTSFLEGCGEIRQVAGLRLWQCLANTAFAWTCMLTHHGLFAPGMMMIASALVGTIFLWRRRRLLLGLLRYPSGGDVISWQHEIWPFQWKIAVSWLCAYFTRQIFTPILFHYRNAVEAGQMGMSISVVGYISAIVLAWMTTKAPVFGSLVARREYKDLDRLFNRTLLQAMSFLIFMSFCCMFAVIFLNRFFPSLAGRLVSPRAFALLLVGTLGSVLVQSIAIYLRSFKREPFLWQSVAVAVLTLLVCRISVRTMGTMGISISYLVCTGGVGVLSAWMIFRGWRRAVEETAVLPVSFGGTK